MNDVVATPSPTTPPLQNNHSHVRTLGIVCGVIALCSIFYFIFVSNKQASIKQCEEMSSLTVAEHSLLDTWQDTIYSLNDEVSNLTSTPDKSDAQFELMSEKNTEIDGLYASTTALLTSVAEREIGSIGENQIGGIYKEYCTDGANIMWLSRMSNSSFIPTEGTGETYLGPAELMCRLDAHRQPDGEIPSALYLLALNFARGGNDSRAVNFYDCAASNYFDIASMARLAQLYYFGTDGLRLNIQNPKDAIVADKQKAYFWVVAAIQTETEEGKDYRNMETDLDYKLLSMLDSLQQDTFLTDDDLMDTEKAAIEFVAQRFPSITENHVNVYAHSMRAMIQVMDGPHDITCSADASGAQNCVVSPK